MNELTTFIILLAQAFLLIKFIDMAKLFLLTFVLAVTLGYSFGAVCPNPSAYAGQSLCYPSNPPQYCGECVSFYKVRHPI